MPAEYCNNNFAFDKLSYTGNLDYHVINLQDFKFYTS